MDEDGYFGELVAARYDQSVADMSGPDVVDPAVGFLAELAGGGPALELGIGTGRIALPLARRWVPVHGIDLPGRWWPGCGTSRAAMRSA